jgi:hypothetical protein
LGGGSSSSFDSIANFARFMSHQKFYTKFWLGMTVLELYKQRSEYYSYTHMIIVCREESIPHDVLVKC